MRTYNYLDVWQGCNWDNRQFIFMDKPKRSNDFLKEWRGRTPFLEISNLCNTMPALHNVVSLTRDCDPIRVRISTEILLDQSYSGKLTEYKLVSPDKKTMATIAWQAPLYLGSLDDQVYFRARPHLIEGSYRSWVEFDSYHPSLAVIRIPFDTPIKVALSTTIL